MLTYLKVCSALVSLRGTKFPKAILIFCPLVGICSVNLAPLCGSYIVKSSNDPNASNDPNLLYKFKKTFR